MTLGTVHPGHGTVKPATCYNYGCRHPDCRAAATLNVKKYRVRRARQGAQKVSAQPWHTAIKAASTAGVNLHSLARSSGVPYETLSNLNQGRVATIHMTTANRLAEPLRDAVERQVQLAKKAMNYVWCVVEPAPAVEKDTRRWPVEPLKAALVARYGSLKSAVDANRRRDLHRLESLPTDKAEQICVEMDLLPDMVWGPAWWSYEGVEEAG